jgi:hypothetical protein
MMSSQRPWFTEPQSLEMTTERFLDADEPDPEGNHEYYYAGVWYVFEQGGREASARRYDDHPDDVSIVGFWVDRRPNDPRRRPPAYVPYYDPFLAAIVRRILQDGQIHRVRFLCRDGYHDIDVRRLFAHQGPFWRVVGWFWNNPWRIAALFGLAGIGRALTLLWFR